MVRTGGATGLKMAESFAIKGLRGFIHIEVSDDYMPNPKKNDQGLSVHQQALIDALWHIDAMVKTVAKKGEKK